MFGMFSLPIQMLPPRPMPLGYFQTVATLHEYRLRGKAEMQAFHGEFKDHQTAKQNFIRLHGEPPPPEMDFGTLLDEYLFIPTMAELSERLDALDRKVEAFKSRATTLTAAAKRPG